MTITKNTSGNYTIEVNQMEMNLISMSFSANMMKLIEIGVSIDKGTGKEVNEMRDEFFKHCEIKL